jgi:hypothetical protein
MRTIITLILIMVLPMVELSAQQPAGESSARQEIASLPSSALVQVDLKDGHRFLGHIVSRTDLDFSLQRQKGERTQTIAYDQVLSVSQVKHGHSHKTRWIVIGVVAGVVVVAIVFAYKFTHLTI